MAVLVEMEQQKNSASKPSSLAEQKRLSAEKRRKFERDIVIRKCENMDRRLERLAEPEKFLKGYFPREFSRPFSVDQLDAIGTILDCVASNTDEIICAPRGDWKTETLKHVVIYLILAEMVRFPLWIGATGESAGKSFEHIKLQFTSELLAADFPEVCDPIIALNFSPQRAKKMTVNGQSLGSFRWDSSVIILPDVDGSSYGGVTMTYRGLDAHVRGLNILGNRPDMAACDDLETEESARMDGQIETRESLLDNAIGGLASGETIPRIVLGTIQNMKCLTRKKLIQWGGKRYQAVHKWPDSEEAIKARTEYIEMRCEERRKGVKTYDDSYQFYSDNQALIELGLAMGSPHNYSSKFREDGRPLEISAFQRVLNAAADKGWSYVFTEIQNDPQEENTNQNLQITPTRVASQLSGLFQNQLPRFDNVKITCGLDIGNFYSYWVKVAWFGNATGVILDYGVAENPGAKTGMDQQLLDATLLPSLMQWRTDILSINPPSFCLIDSGSGTHTEIVYEFVRSVGGVPFEASKGWDRGRFRIGEPSEKRRCYYECYAEDKRLIDKVWLYHVNTEFWKHWIHERFVTPAFNEANQFNDGSLSFYVDPNDPRKHTSISHHVCSEMRETRFVEGKGMVTNWVQKNQNNHYLDALALACAAAGVLGVRLIKRESMIDLPSQPTKRPAEQRKPQTPSRFIQRPGGWLHGARK